MGSDDHNESAANQYKGADIDSKSVDPSIVRPSPSTNLEASENQPASNHEKRITKQAFRKWSLRINGILAIAAIFGGILYFCQLRQMDHAARLDQRAWVAPAEILGLPEANKPYNVIIFMKNTGKTFAKRVETTMGVEVLLKGQQSKLGRLNAPAPANRSSGIVAPNTGFRVEYKMNPNVTSDELKIYNSGDKLIDIYGRISYKDIFDCDHWTKFCFVYDGENGYRPCEEQQSNDADDGKCP